MSARYAAEPGLLQMLQNLYEGIAALNLSRKNNNWFETGVFTSHPGFKSAKGDDNWILTRSFTAENSLIINPAQKFVL
jgi:hypothetical protein